MKAIFTLLMLAYGIVFGQTITSITKAPQQVKIINEGAGGVPYDANSTASILQKMVVYKRSACPPNNNLCIVAFQHDINVPSITLSNTAATCQTRHWQTSVSVSKIDTYAPEVTIPFNVGTVTYTVSNPALVEIVSANTYRPNSYSTTDVRKAIFIKESASVTAGQSLGTLTVSVVVDGVTYNSQTVNLVAASNYVSITHGETGFAATSIDITNKQYSTDNGATWNALPTSPFTLPVGTSFKVRATFVNSASSTTLTYGKIIGTGVSTSNVLIGTANSSTVITSPTTTVTGSMSIEFNINSGV